MGVGLAMLPLPLQLQRVQSVARKRGTSLHLLPQGMARHTLNTSRTVWNRDQSVLSLVVVHAVNILCAHVQETVECGVEGEACVPSGSTGVL